MAAKIISGTEIAAQIREELKKEIAEMKETRDCSRSGNHTGWEKSGLCKLCYSKAEDRT
ncbi:MAG: hypothetical protein QMD44_01215 [Thermodesulfovibrionales bacterium]|nr:hypothetical protein [Thermodesulfovibrionales bacterium]